MIVRLCTFVLFLIAANAAGADPAQTRAKFLAAHKLAKAGLDWRTAAPELASYPLLPYLEHAELMRKPRPDSAALLAFIERHGDQPLTRPLRSQLIARRAQVADWAGVRALAIDGLPLVDRCHLHRAAIELGELEGLEAKLRPLWLNARALPGACHPLEHLLRARGVLDAATVWERVELAVAAQQSGLLRTLAGELAGKDKAAVLHLADLLADSGRARQAAKKWPDDAAHRRALALGLARIAMRDDALAASLWREFQQRFSFADGEKYQVIDAIALYRANSFEADAASWLDLLPPGQDSAATREWRLREALARRDLAAAQRALERFDERQLADPRWQYWRARVAELNGDTAAAAGHYRALAASPSFFGFLAAERAQRPYALCPLPAVNAADAERALAVPGFARAFELHALGWLREARLEWDAALAAADAAQRLQAVTLADLRGWHDRAPFALNAADDLRVYTLRFPLAHRELIVASAQRHALSPSFVFGLIRSESAWVADAKSHANAYGLMQLIPDTARRMARAEKRNFINPLALFDPALNVALGTRYLSGMLQRYGGAHWLAAAAYNAGPARVDQWLAQRGQLEPDLFVETIPFRETREYVARVLAFALIYDWRLNGKAFSLEYALSRGAGTPPPRREVACPAAPEPGLPTPTPAATAP
jgi:soluble lytic murein transglycosylase